MDSKEEISFKNKINVFYVTIPSEHDDEHTFVNTINLKEASKKVNITFYASFINIDDTEIFARIRYAMSNDEYMGPFSGFTESFTVGKVPGTTLTSFNISADFVLQTYKLACFEIQLLKKNPDENFEILDSKKCYAEVNWAEGI